MPKRVILITGTPCVGKTSTARLLTSKLKALYINLTKLAVKENLTLRKDKKRNTIIIDENNMRKKISQIIKNSKEDNIIIDGHYAASVVPKQLVSYAFVLRCDPVKLKKLMEKCGFSEHKLWENLASEILDVCLYDAVNAYGEEKICEIDASNRSVEEIIIEILKVLKGSKKCHVGIVDWIDKLESEGLLQEYLKI